MRMGSDMPLSSGDLRVIADAVSEVENSTLAGNGLLGRIEVFRPDGGDVVGWVARFDDRDPDMGWGFIPVGKDR